MLESEIGDIVTKSSIEDLATEFSVERFITEFSAELLRRCEQDVSQISTLKDIKLLDSVRWNICAYCTVVDSSFDCTDIITKMLNTILGIINGAVSGSMDEQQ